MRRDQKLEEIAKRTKNRLVDGLDKNVVYELLEEDDLLAQCVDEAYDSFQVLQRQYPSFFDLSDEEKIKKIQKNIVNFYSPETVNPYIPLSAKGPWVVTTGGAVVHDSGGYGMLGFGHQPESILPAVTERKDVMANVMTPSFAQFELCDLLLKEIGHSRKKNKEASLEKFVFLNSGSEASGFALRVTDAKALNLMQKEPGKTRKFLTLKQSFHGRTDFSAKVSSSSLDCYKKNLASFKDLDDLLTVEINNISELKKVFLEAEKSNVYIQAVIFEPVMGEGNPGVCLSPEFYRAARVLSRKHGSSFIIDSIQAGIRATGALSVLDYPGFQGEEAPDCEVYSKALNAGQYPLSVVAMTNEFASFYKYGLYGNTMTSNPRAMSIACHVLRALTPAVRENIRARGEEFVREGLKLKAEYDWLIEDVHGTGLLFCLEINKKVIDVVGENGLETLARKAGVGVIHGGQNALRFTPWFSVSSLEVTLIYNRLREVFNTLRS